MFNIKKIKKEFDKEYKRRKKLDYAQNNDKLTWNTEVNEKAQKMLNEIIDANSGENIQIEGQFGVEDAESETISIEGYLRTSKWTTYEKLTLTLMTASVVIAIYTSILLTIFLMR